jgi:hypothetical protein
MAFVIPLLAEFLVARAISGVTSASVTAVLTSLPGVSQAVIDALRSRDEDKVESALHSLDSSQLDHLIDGLAASFDPVSTPAVSEEQKWVGSRNLPPGASFNAQGTYQNSSGQFYFDPTVWQSVLVDNFYAQHPTKDPRQLVSTPVVSPVSAPGRGYFSQSHNDSYELWHLLHLLRKKKKEKGKRSSR